MASAPQSWSSVGKKVVIAITGAALALFLVGHLAGNLLILLPDGGETFDAYGHALISNPLVYVVEAGLITIFLLHVGTAINNLMRNRSARPSRYYAQEWAGHTSRKSLASTAMAITGVVMLVFIPLHVVTFKFGVGMTELEPTDGVRHLADMVRTAFENPLWVIWYQVALALLGMHLWHGVSSAFQSLGISHPRYEKWILGFGWGFALLIAGGFFLLPITIFLGLA